MNRVRLLAVLTLLSTACTPWIATSDASFGSIASTSSGLLMSAASFDPDPAQAVLYRPFNRNYATADLVSLVGATAEHLHRQFPDTRLYVGDFSSRNGGRISEHGSHRSGRDVDLAFALTNLQGRSTAVLPMVPLDHFGTGLRGQGIVRFDVARNWAIVEGLLTGDDSNVQWIFVSNGLKALLLQHAIDIGASTALLDRAARVLHQPSAGTWHDDHFHVRIFCPKGTDGSFCRDALPSRPWRQVDTTAQIPDSRRIALALDGL